MLPFTEREVKLSDSWGKRGNGTAGRCDKGHELQPLSEGLRMGTRRRRSPSVETSRRAAAVHSAAAPR